MTPAQAKQVFGRTTVKVALHGKESDWWYGGGMSLGHGNDVVVVTFGAHGSFSNQEVARRHAREFFKKLGLKVRFGK